MNAMQRNAVRQYNKQFVETANTLKDADPRPGKMTPEQERSQCALVNAWLDVEESGAYPLDDRG